jgi:hypothetical protein
VLADKRFSQYHAKFAGPKPDQAILTTMYDCVSYAEPDTLGVDSLDLYYEESPVSELEIEDEEQPAEPETTEPATTEEQPADDGTGH